MSTLSPEEALALGIGNPDELTIPQLRAFFSIVNPIESKQGMRTKSLKRDARNYLNRALPQDFLRNALSMSKSKNQIESKYLDYVVFTTKEYQILTHKIHQNVKAVNEMMKRDYDLDVEACAKNLE
jgi:hypothetical protein